MDDIVDLVRRSLAEETRDEFGDRVDAQADALREAIAAGGFDNDDFAVGLEVELYAINAEPEPIEPEEDEADEAVEARLEEELAGDDESALEDLLLPGREDAADGTDGSDMAAEFPDDGGDGSPDHSGDDVDEPYMDPADWEGRLTTIPESVFGDLVAKELGKHNAEVNTEPNRFVADGLAVQTASVEMQVKRARDVAAAENRELVLDAMWTIPPEEGSEAYLSATEERDGVVLAENMRSDPRYAAIDNDALEHAGGAIDLSVPGAEHSFPTILFESLTTSIQPHLQIPAAAAFPAYYNAAIRTMGPVLSLTTNSPFLPSDLYNRVDDPYALLEATHHELRVAAFEQAVNTSPNPKVRVPADLASAEDVVDRVVADDTFAPFLREWIEDGDREALADEYWEFDHKRGTFWRWLRCVVGGDPVENAGDEASLRIEYRPIPTQPTVEDLVGAQTLVTGLIRGLVEHDHPLAELPWQDAKDGFYSAAREGPDAALAWITADGQRTADREVIYDELFAYARRGLAAQDVPDDRIDAYLAPIERRRAIGETPSSWKIGRVREHLDDGHDLVEALHEMQRDYVELSREHHTFADWV